MNKIGRPRGVSVIQQCHYMAAAGKRMQDVLNAKDVSLTELSQKTGISRTTVWNFVYNGIDISSARLAKICAYCGVSTDYILGLKEA